MQDRFSLWRQHRHQFCSRCRQIFAYKTLDEALYGWQPHHANRKELQKAASAGCFICRIVLEDRIHREATFGHGFNSEQGTIWSRFQSWSEEGDPPAYRIRLLGSETKDGPPSVLDDGRVDFLLQPESVARTYLPCRDLPDSTSDSAVVQLARTWLETCYHNHQQCSPPTATAGFSPSRLVEIQLTNSSPDIVRIIETSETPIDGPYMTLSHRWGTQSFPLLTRDKLRDMKNGFDAAILPTAFRDAIRITRAFQVRWLWIDCLCILQDSKDDFQVQAGLMYQVYGNSYCNLSATGAVDNHQSLFVSRTLSDFDPPQVQLRSNGEKRDYRLLHETLFRHSVLGAPVNQRGWVVQERLLSPRVLHFARQQLFWECREHTACELFPDGLPDRLDRNSKRLFDKNLQDSTLLKNLGPLNAWTTVVEVYSRCALTNPDDKLIAIAGVAARMRSLSEEDEYLAGLWKSNIFESLTWHYTSNAVGKRRPEKWRAPSWSWASVEASPSAALEFTGGPLTASGMSGPYSLVEAQVVPLSTANPFGAVSSASLKIKGRLARFAFVGGCKPAPSMSDCEINGHRYDVLVYFDDEEPILDDDLFSIHDHADGLLLRPTGRSKGEYSRVGYLGIKGDTTGMKKPDFVDDDHVNDEDKLPCVSYDPERKQHIFTLV